MTLTTFNVGGVPEHFNLPIHLAHEGGQFADKGIEINWVDYGGGTGAMTQALRVGTCDICILLTEGIVADIINHNPAKIISGYVKSPLIWGIHTFTGRNELLRDSSLFQEKIAISRKGSGSHLMPIVNALMSGESIDDDQFVEVKNMDGALQSLKNQETSIFYWEKYTTKPFVKAGRLSRMGEFISPWPCFMIAARNDIIEQYPDTLDRFLKVVHKSCASFMANEMAPEMVAQRYGIDLKDARYWFHSTEWSVDSWVSNKTLVSVLFALKEAGIIPPSATVDGLIWKRE